MDGVGIKGIKLKLKKRYLIAWIVCIAVCIVAFSATLGYSALEYAEYCEAQDVAIATTTSILPEFKKYDIETEKSDLIRAIYNHYNPRYITYPGVSSDLYDAAYDAASDADRAFGKVMTTLGYSCYYGSEYLEHTSFLSFASHETDTFYFAEILLAVTVSVIIAFVVVITTYKKDQKKNIEISENAIICNKSAKKTIQFMLKDITSVELTGRNALLIKGNNIKHKVARLANAEELKETIMNKLSEISQASNPVMESTTSSADELIKYKELLDDGIISQEEFDAKKKQLLGL